MTIFTLVLILLLLSGLCTANSPNDLQLENTEYEFEALASNGRALEQTTSRNAYPQEDETAEINCSEVTRGVDLFVEEDSVLRTFTARSMIRCCRACQSMENCTTFRRNRSNGSCELINDPLSSFEINPTSDYDAGGFLWSESMLVVDETSAPIPDCRTIQGRTYPNGSILTQGNSPSSEHCCETCRSSRDCNSWYYNNRSGRCTLNRNIPASVTADSSRFSGGSV